MNIRLRLTLWYTAILFIILLIFSVSLYVALESTLFVSLDTHLQQEAAQVIGGLEFIGRESDDKYDDDEVAAALTVSGLRLRYVPEEGVLWRIFDRNGQVLVDPGYFKDAIFRNDALPTDYARLEYATLADNVPVKVYTVPFVIEGRGAGIVQIAESYHHIQQVQQLLVFLLAIGIPFTILATTAGGWFLATHALQPIDRITSAARQISASDLNRRLNMNLPNDEIGRLATTFDDMLARLEAGFDQQKRFIADASHEMRTPLTILKGEVDVTLNRPRTAATYRETLELVDETTNQLIALVEELFLLARADNQQLPLQLTRFNLAELISRAASRLVAQAEKRNVALHIDIPPALPIVADADKLTRLVLNLVSNAIKYTRPGDDVTVSVAAEGRFATLTIADTGPGIPAEHLAHLFDRFYRVDKARSRSASVTDTNSSGAGLGLSIVKRLVDLHNGRIDVASEVGQGTTFVVWLPLQPPADDTG